MSKKLDQIKHRIEESKKLALSLPEQLKSSNGYKYTLNHDVDKHPAAILYGTWAVAYLRKLILGNDWKDEEEKSFIKKSLLSARLANGLFFPNALYEAKFPKSYEYMYLHCYNYAVGAALEIDPNFDFQSKYMDYFLDADFLKRWLDQRSFQRPWEESNNIVNVASYLALCNDYGNDKGKEGLCQMLEWHNKHQNPKMGGFEKLGRSRKNILQSMAGAVHNFHIHHYLKEPMNYEKLIAKNVTPFLFEGPLTACLSIDFVELACSVYHKIEDKKDLEQALLYHLEALLNYQNSDGGWCENETPKRPTVANGMKEKIASSNSYATWFRLCSIGMIAITLFNDEPTNWYFRKTLGMGYASDNIKQGQIETYHLDTSIIRKYKKINRPHILKKKLIEFGVRILKR